MIEKLKQNKKRKKGGAKMGSKIDITNLSKLQLKRLRQDIVLNSIYYKDYQNRYNLDLRIVFELFDGFLDYIENELEPQNSDFNDKLIKYDNIATLWNYYSSLEW